MDKHKEKNIEVTRLQTEVTLFSAITYEGDPLQRLKDALVRLRETVSDLEVTPYDRKMMADCLIELLDVADRAGVPVGLLIHDSFARLNEKRNGR